MLLAEINNAVDDEPLFISPLTVDANAAKAKLHRFDLSRVCGKIACIIYRQQIDQVEFEHHRSNMW